MIVIIVFVIIIILLITKGKLPPVEQFKAGDGWVLEKGPDGLEYLVRPSKVQKEVAASLSKLHGNMTRIIAELNIRQKNGSLPDHMLVPTQNLNKKYSHKAIREGIEEQEYTSFSLDKKEIHFCVKSRDGTNLIYDDNLLLYVGLHECAHMGSPSEGHNQQFKDIFSYLLQVGRDIGVYTPVDFQNSPVNYCGLILNKS